jgi:hypothetical protein
LLRVRINQAAFAPLPFDATQKLPGEPSVMFDPGERQFVAEWPGCLDRPTAALLEAEKPPMPHARRAEILATARLMLGRQRKICDCGEGALRLVVCAIARGGRATL